MPWELGKKIVSFLDGGEQAATDLAAAKARSIPNRWWMRCSLMKRKISMTPGSPSPCRCRPRGGKQALSLPNTGARSESVLHRARG